MGFANKLDTIHNGMNGGKILLMVPGGNYSAVTGLDLSVGSNIGAYVIDDKDSAFRHWVDTGSAADGASHEHTDCFTALTFESDHISGQKFNLEEGSDEIIWAGNSNDYYVGYHSSESRARLTVNWLTGNVDFFISKPPAWQTTADDTDTDTLGDDTTAGDGSSSDDKGTDVVANDQLGDAAIADDSSSSYAVVSASVGLTVMIISAMMFWVTILLGTTGATLNVHSSSNAWLAALALSLLRYIAHKQACVLWYQVFVWGCLLFRWRDDRKQVA